MDAAYYYQVARHVMQGDGLVTSVEVGCPAFASVLPNLEPVARLGDGSEGFTVYAQKRSRRGKPFVAS